jgi:hypothetical protein
MFTLIFFTLFPAEGPAALGAEVRPVHPSVAGQTDGLRWQLWPAEQRLFPQDRLSFLKVSRCHQEPGEMLRQGLIWELTESCSELNLINEKKSQTENWIRSLYWKFVQVKEVIISFVLCFTFLRCHWSQIDKEESIFYPIFWPKGLSTKTLHLVTILRETFWSKKYEIWFNKKIVLIFASTQSHMWKKAEPQLWAQEGVRG